MCSLAWAYEGLLPSSPMMMPDTSNSCWHKIGKCMDSAPLRVLLIFKAQWGLTETCTQNIAWRGWHASSETGNMAGKCSLLFSVLQRHEDCQKGEQLDYMQYPAYTEGWRQEGKAHQQSVILFSCSATKKVFATYLAPCLPLKNYCAFSAYCRVNIQYSAWGMTTFPITIYGSCVSSSLHWVPFILEVANIMLKVDIRAHTYSLIWEKKNRQQGQC